MEQIEEQRRPSLKANNAFSIYFSVPRYFRTSFRQDLGKIIFRTTLFKKNYFILQNLRLPFLVIYSKRSPYFDHDAFMHHALHVLDAPVEGGSQQPKDERKWGANTRRRCGMEDEE